MIVGHQLSVQDILEICVTVGQYKVAYTNSKVTRQENRTPDYSHTKTVI